LGSPDDDIKSLDFAIRHIETELRDRPPAQEGALAMLKVIETLKSMRAELERKRRSSIVYPCACETLGRGGR
jgi:hypothetical protein